MRVVIIGGSSAGVSAATHLRRRDENAEIIIIERSNEFAVAACGLPYLLAGKIKDKDDIIGASVAQMQQIFKVDVRLNTEVLTINPHDKQLNLSGNQTLDYDQLIIAAGGLQLRPDIPGILADNIFTMHSLYSTQKIIDYFWGLNAKRVLILGGGKIGLRAAQALLENQAKVTLVDNASHILSDLDYDFALMVQQKLEQKGLTILTNTSVKEFLPDKAVLSNGTKIKYDIAIIATGNKSEVRLPIMTDIEIGETGGIIVNNYMQTSIDDILACGDNIQVDDLITNMPIRISNASLAVRSAKIAADNAVGIQSRLGAVLKNQVLKVFDYVIGAAGCNEDDLKKAGIPYHKLYFAMENGESYVETSQKMRFKLLFGLDGKILGFQAMGKEGIFGRLNVVAAIMNYQGSVQELAEMPIAYFPELSRAKDALNDMGSLALEISFERLRVTTSDDLKTDDVILNVCAADRFKQRGGHQAINIPLAALRKNLTSLPKNKKIIVTCNGGYASYLAYCILTQRGFDRVFLLNSPEIWQ